VSGETAHAKEAAKRSGSRKLRDEQARKRTTTAKRTAAKRKTRDSEPPAARVSQGGARFAVFCAEFVRQTKGRWARQPLFMEPYQLLEIVSPMLETSRGAWLDLAPSDVARILDDPHAFYATLAKWLREHGVEDAGHRLRHEAYIQLPKKTGKSTLCSAAGLYFLVADGEMGAEVYAAATAKDQARIVFQQARETVQASPRLQDWVKLYRDAITVEETNSTFRVISADAGVQEGINPSASIVDETFRHKTRDLYDVLTSGDIAREEPFTFCISNAGTDLDTLGGALYAQAKQVLAGATEARDDLFAYVPEVGDHEIEDRDAWQRVNRSSWITTERLEKERKRFPPAVFERRHLNRWTAAEVVWLEPSLWDECKGKPVFDDGDDVFVGVDLGVKRDTTAVVLVKREETGESSKPKLHVRAHVFAVRGNGEQEPPPAHEHIDGDRVDFALVENFLRDVARDYNVREIAFDPWRFHRSAELLSDEGLTMVEMPQTNERMVPISQNLYDQIVERQLVHDGDDVLRRHVAATAARDVGRGWRLDKAKAARPMDAVVALALAVSRALEDEGGSFGVYF
jgi:phage terminase large subunit-like protein